MVVFGFVFFRTHCHTPYITLVVILLVPKYWFQNNLWVYFLIQGIVILLCVSVMQAASPVILIGLLPVLIAQSIVVYYHTLKVILTGLSFYVLFFLALILVNDTDDLTVYIPVLFLILNGAPTILIDSDSTNM